MDSTSDALAPAHAVDAPIITPLTLDMTCLGPSFSPCSSALYNKLTRRGQLVTIAGTTGVGKSLLAQNCAAYVIQNSGHGVWINCDMSIDMVQDRMRCILTGSTMAGADGPQLDANACHVIAEMNKGQHWLIAPFSVSSNLRLEGIIDQAILKQDEKTRIVVVDGFDRLRGTLDADAFDELCTQMATLAANRKLCIVITSQCVRDACGQEIVGADDLAYSMGKANAASLVVTLGRRAPQLLTCMVVKDRAGLFRDQQVYRLQVEPSLRLTTMDVVNPIQFDPRAPDDELEIKCVNCSKSDIGIEDSEADDADDTDHFDAPHSGARLYHGNTGFIGIGRGVFESAMYRTMQLEDLGQLLSLYEMAAISPARLYAPATRVPVIIKRGQVMTSLQVLSHYWRISKKQVERFLSRAEQEGLIRVERIGPNGKIVTTSVTPPRTLATVITLCNYDSNEGAQESFGEKLSR